ncbi:MAG: hypothetical protein K6U11_08880, partial [bacterium]|nr:hypothetical protein [bacterium]
NFLLSLFSLLPFIFSTLFFQHGEHLQGNFGLITPVLPNKEKLVQDQGTPISFKDVTNSLPVRHLN